MVHFTWNKFQLKLCKHKATHLIPSLILLIGLICTLLLVKVNQDNRQHAETTGTLAPDNSPDIISDVDQIIQPYTHGDWNVNKDITVQDTQPQKTVLLLGGSRGNMLPRQDLALQVLFSDTFHPHDVQRETTLTVPLTEVSNIDSITTDYRSRISTVVPIRVFTTTFSQVKTPQMPQIEGTLKLYVFYAQNKAVILGLLQNVSLHSPYGLDKFVRSLTVVPTQSTLDGAPLRVYGMTNENLSSSPYSFSHIRNTSIANIFTGSNQIAFTVDYYNFSPKTHLNTSRVTIIDSETGQLVDSQTLTKEVAFGTNQDTLITKWGKFGVFQLALNRVPQTRYAHVPDPAPSQNIQQGIHFGVNYFWQQVPWQTYSPEISHMIGQTWGRLWFGDEAAWYRQQWQQGSKPDFTRLTKSLDTMDTYGQSLYYTISTAPPWAKPHPNTPVWTPGQLWNPKPYSLYYGVDFEGPTAAHLADFENYFNQLYTTLGSRIHLFDTGNEINTDCTWINTYYDSTPNSCNGDGLSLNELPSYVQFHRVVADYLHSHGYTGIVTAPSIAGTLAQNGWNHETQSPEWGPWPKWIQQFGQLGGFTNTTAFSFHPYVGFDLSKYPAVKDPAPEENGLPTVLDSVRQKVTTASSTSLPLIMSEYGFPADYTANDTQLRTNETNQANYLIRESIMGVGRGDVPVALYYALQDTGDNTIVNPSESGFGSYGLLYLGYTPKVSLAADAGMAKMLSGATGLGEATDIFLPSGSYGYKFKDRDGNIVYVFWTEDGESASVSIPLPVDLGRGVTVYDKYTNILKSTINITSGKATVQIGPSPVYVVTGRNPVGYVVRTCQIVTGWVCDPSDTSKPIDVHVYLDGNPFINGGQFIGGVRADQSSSDPSLQKGVSAFCGGTSNHIFSFPLPNSVRDGRPHTINTFGINIGDGTTNPLLTPRADTSSTMVCSSK